MRHMGKLLLLCTVCALCISAFCITASAVNATSPMTVNITTVIDNAGDIPGTAGGGTYHYKVIRTTRMTSSYGCLVPSTKTEQTFSWTSGGVSTQSFPRPSGSTNCDIFLFETAASTDPHISLSYIELPSNSNAARYTYTNSGTADPPVQAFNWVQVVNESLGSINVTLHFRYNPDIDELPPPPDPNPEYTKKIDYLGDGVPNPDTSANGVNDYRLYLTLDTEVPTAEPADKDIIFILDISNSMDTAIASGVSRLQQMKTTVNAAVDVLTQNTANRISVISFESYVNTVISHSASAVDIKAAVSGLKTPQSSGGSGGGTNYYDALQQAGRIVSGLLDPSRETVVFFLTDGEPTACLPAVNALGYSTQASVALLYAEYSGTTFPTVDRFYSVFIGNSLGSASTLQTITQRISVNIEKFMVQATSPAQLNNTFSRFLAQVDDSLYGVTIEDVLSEYVDYIGESKVTKISGSGESVVLANGSDYSMSYDAASRRIRMSLLQNTSAASHYILSFNVRASSAALDYKDENLTYPNIGDEDTDYPGNFTSSGQPGLYSNEAAKLTYFFGGSGQGEQTYPKPVIQVVSPDAVPAEIRVRKNLEGKTLEEGMFSFELYAIQEVESEAGEEPELTEVLMDTTGNDADGFIVFENISFSKPGSYSFLIKEVIPAEPLPGMTYDDKEIEVTVRVFRNGEDLEIEVIYPSEAVFTNRYEPQPVEVPIGVEKELTGRALSAGMFEFRLLTNNNVLVETTANADDGTVSFTPLVFDKAGVYQYLIRESVPFPVNPNVIYDIKTIYAIITVSDNNAVLSAAVTYSPDGVFRNQYVYPPTSATIELTKVLTGMRLSTGMFEFELTDVVTGERIVKENLSDGRVLFDLQYTEPGSHIYRVKELIPSEPIKHMTYDDNVITVTVNVTDDGEGKLSVTTTYSGEPVFYNSYRVRGGIW